MACPTRGAGAAHGDTMSLHGAVRFESDEAENQGTKANHDVGFVRTRLLFDGRPIRTFPGDHAREGRWLTVGLLDGLVSAAVWTTRSEATALNSVKTSHDAEVRACRSVPG